jgi:hypothetical protein
MEEVYAHTYHSSVGGEDGPTTLAGSSEQNAVDLRVILMIADADGYAGAADGVTYIERVGGAWDNAYRTNAYYSNFAFSTTEVMP